MRRGKPLVGRASSMVSRLFRMDKDDVAKTLDLIDAVLLAPEVAQRPGLLVAGRLRIQMDPAAEPSASVVRVYDGRSLLLTIHREPVPDERLVVSTKKVVCEWRCTRSGPRRRLAEIVLIGVGILALRVHHGTPFLYRLDRGLVEQWPDGTRLVATKSATTFVQAAMQ